MILSRPKLLPAQRFDLEDLNALLAAARTDAKLRTLEFSSSLNYVMHGFIVSGIGLKQATINVTDATVIMPQNTFDFSWFTSEPGAPSIVVPQASFQPGVRNYVEIQLVEENNTPMTRAFWDSQANSGVGQEFNQIVNTVTDLAVIFTVLTGGFSGSPNSLPLCIVDVDGSGNIKTILDRRNLFSRLGRTNNIKFSYSWGTRQEPVYNLSLSSVVGAFLSGESISINTETAKVVIGGTSSITFNIPTGVNFFPGSSVTGLSSGATGTVNTILESFIGVDKSLMNEKDRFDAITSEIKLVKGTDFWWQDPSSSLSGVASNIDSFLVSAVEGAKWFWDGNNLSVTDGNVSPSSSDILGNVRIFGSTQQFNLQRQDGSGGSIVIPVPEQSIVFVKLPTTGNRSFSGVGSASTNYQVVDIGSYVPSDGTYWIAYRNTGELYVRDYGELDAGESTPISDPDKITILNLINANKNKANQDRNIQLVRGGIWSYAISPDTTTWSSQAAIQVAGLPESRNNILAGSVVLPNDGDIAYVTINRVAGSPANLTVNVANISTASLGDNDVVIVRKFGSGSGSSVLAGYDAFRLISGQSKELESGLSIQNRTYLEITDESSSAPNYSASSAGSLALPNFNTINGEGLPTRISKINAMLADDWQDLNIELDPGIVGWDGTNISVTGASLSIPGTTIGATPVSINTFGSTALASNSCLYVDISRTSGSSVTLVSDLLSNLTPSQQRLILFRNISGNILVR